VQGRAWREKMLQASAVSLTFPCPPPSCARKVELQLCEERGAASACEGLSRRETRIWEERILTRSLRGL
jgi:hypothetical protein